MKNVLKLCSVLLLTVLMFSCSKEEDPVAPVVTPTPKVYGCTDSEANNFNPSATDNDGTCTYVGKVIFWTNFNPNENITVNINNKTGYISSYFSTGSPDCDTPGGSAVFEFPVGQYTYQATTSSGSWTGSVTITKNTCFKNLLVQ